MDDIVLGSLCIIAGLALCFRGYRAMRIVMPLWGAFAGFALGAGLVAAATGDELLSGPLGWIVGVSLAVVFGYLAYAYYAASVIISMAAIGFSIGATVLLALGDDWNWLVILGSIAVGALLAMVAIALDLPTVLLVIVTATSGASAIVTGILFLTDTLSTADATRADVVSNIDDSVLWWALYAVLVIAGVMAQIGKGNRAAAAMREQYA